MVEKIALQDEFALIRDCIEGPVAERQQRADVRLGIGDDAAVVQVPAGQQLLLAMDSLVVGRHFPHDADPADIAYKALATNLSDIAAMGGRPCWACLSLSMPRARSDWLRRFIQGFTFLADRSGVQLVGGDLVQGPLVITVQIHGTVPHGLPLCRHGARPGDLLCVSGKLGQAALGLLRWQRQQRQKNPALQRFCRPAPRLALGLFLRRRASACIDLSDGLATDLPHLLRASAVGAIVALERLPLSSALSSMPFAKKWQMALAGGDDYELCFCLPPHQWRQRWPTPITVIGRIVAGSGLRYRWRGKRHDLRVQGYRHFS